MRKGMFGKERVVAFEAHDLLSHQFTRPAADQWAQTRLACDHLRKKA